MWKSFIIILIFGICVNGELWSRRHKWGGRRRGQHRKGLGHFMSDKLFGNNKWSFGLGPIDQEPWLEFNVDFEDSASAKPWWKGPNVCHSLTEELNNDTTSAISNHFSFQSIVCDGTDTTFKCVKKQQTSLGEDITTEVYECCPGFSRQSSDNGCTQEIPLMNLTNLMESLNVTEFIKLIDSVGLTQKLLKDDSNSLTIFAPKNKAVMTLPSVFSSMEMGLVLQDIGSVVMVSEEIKDSVVDNTMNIVLGHIAVGNLTSPHFSNNDMLETASPLKTKIRINIYQRPIKVITANCKEVTSADNVATNGVIHVTNDILKPVTDTLMDLIQKNPELSMLKTALGSSPLAAMLRKDGQYTLFAPTDAAFKKDQELITKIMASPDCMENVLKNHLLPNVICSTVIQGTTTSVNSIQKSVELTRDATGKLHVDGTYIAASDIMATNGVLYIIDDVLIPEEALGILDLAEKKALTEFTKLISLADLKKDLGNATSVTVFVPSNEAIQALMAEEKGKLVSDHKLLKRVLQHHMIPDVLSRDKFYNNLQLTTQAGTQLRVNEYSMFPFDNHWTQTIQCASIETSYVRGCKGAIYVINKVLFPPAGNVVDILAQNSDLSIFVQLIKMAGVADRLQESGPYTLFAPTNKAFEALGSRMINELKRNGEKLKSVVLNHISEDAICCAGMTRGSWFDTQKIRVLSGQVYNIGKDLDKNVFIGDSDISRCDLPATNGVVHIINKALNETNRRKPWQWFLNF